MSGAAHTPGPWAVTTEVDKDGYGRHTVRAASNGLPLACLENYNGHEREANAHLMASSPDLLSALDQIANGVLLDAFNHGDNGLLELASRCDDPYIATNLRRHHAVVVAAIVRSRSK